MITFSPSQCLAMLLLIDREDLLTDALTGTRQKLSAEYKRLTGEDPPLTGLRHSDWLETVEVNQFQRRLMEQYFAMDPGARLLGYHQGRPVLQVYVAPIRFRDLKTKRHVVGVSLNGAPFDLPKSSWQKDFIPADGITWTEAVTIVEEWFTWGKAMVGVRD